MTLYESILEYEKGAGAPLDIELDRGLPSLEELDLNNGCWERVLLDEAYRLKGAELCFTIEDLDFLLDRFSLMEKGLLDSFPEVNAARKKWIEAKIRFYHDLIDQDQNQTYEGAVKAKFGNESLYRAALHPVIEAELGIMNACIEDAVERNKPEMAEILKAGCRAWLTGTEKSINAIFPEPVKIRSPWDVDMPEL